MVATWFNMRYCPWSWSDFVLYLCICGTGRSPFAFWCAEGGMESVSYGMTCGSR